MSSVAKTMLSGKFQADYGDVAGPPYRVLSVRKPEFPVPEESTEYLRDSRGDYVAQHHAYQMTNTAKLPVDADANFDDLGWWAQLALGWHEEAGDPVGGGLYEYAWTGSDPHQVLKPAHINVFDNQLMMLLRNTLAESWEISGGDGKGPKPMTFKAALVGVPSAVIPPPAAPFTAHVVPDLSGRHMLFRNTELFLDASAAAIGTTRIGCHLMGFSLKGDNKLDLHFPADCWLTDSNGGYSGHEREERYVEVELDLLLSGTTVAEALNYLAEEPRFVRLRNAAAGREWRFDVSVAKWAKFEAKANGATRRITLLGRSVFSPALGTDWRMALKNNIDVYV